MLGIPSYVTPTHSQEGVFANRNPACGTALGWFGFPIEAGFDRGLKAPSFYPDPHLTPSQERGKVRGKTQQPSRGRRADQGDRRRAVLLRGRISKC